MFERFRLHDRHPIDPGARLPAGERVYAIGDVHGEARLLTRLLRQVEADSRERGAAHVTLVLLGDVIDRGPRSAELLRTLHRLENPAFVLLKGNHENLLAASWHGNEEALDLWLHVGGRSTLIGFGLDPRLVDTGKLGEVAAAMRGAIDPAIVRWVEALPTAWSMGDYFFAHAGVRPGIELDRQHDEDLMWVRASFLASRSNHGKVVVHGHSVEPGVPRLGGNRIGLDTGAHGHRRLTALGLEGDGQWLLQASDAATAPVCAPVRLAEVA